MHPRGRQTRRWFMTVWSYLCSRGSSRWSSGQTDSISCKPYTVVWNSATPIRQKKYEQRAHSMPCIRTQTTTVMNSDQIQGQTIDRLIVDINDTYMDMAKLHVSVSRVRRSANLRFIPLRPGTKERVEKLNFPDNVLEWARKNLASAPQNAPVR